MGLGKLVIKPRSLTARPARKHRAQEKAGRSGRDDSERKAYLLLRSG
jgi:hypothetical protein